MAETLAAVGIVAMGCLAVYGWVCLSEKYVEPWVDRVVRKLMRVPPKKRTCNRHANCDAVDAQTKAMGGRAVHCHDECCEDCFGY